VQTAILYYRVPGTQAAGASALKPFEVALLCRNCSAKGQNRPMHLSLGRFPVQNTGKGHQDP